MTVIRSGSRRGRINRAAHFFRQSIRELFYVLLIRDTILFIVIAVGLGVGSAYFGINHADSLGRFDVGPWHAWPQASSPDANPYSKADQARRGSMPLGSGEGLAFYAATDDAGTPLDGACQYRISGGQVPARLWTLSLLNEDGTLVDNPSNRYGFHSREVARVSGEFFEIVTGPDVLGGNWLKSASGTPFRLVLRLYETPLTSGGGLGEIHLPEIAWMSCQ